MLYICRMATKKISKKVQDRLKQFAHPLKMKILNYIKENGPVHVIAIYKGLRIEQSICSSMLSDLRKAKLVKTRKEGRKVFYTVDFESVSETVDELKEHFAE